MNTRVDNWIKMLKYLKKCLLHFENDIIENNEFYFRLFKCAYHLSIIDQYKWFVSSKINTVALAEFLIN